MQKINKEKNRAIEEEVRTGYALIKSGLVTLIEMKENAYHFHLPLFQISNGLERILKCIILINHYSVEGNYPNDKSFFKKESDSLLSGHELNSLFNAVVTIFENSKSHLLQLKFEKDFEYVINNYLPQSIFSLLSHFASETRYRNLNVLLGINNPQYESPEDSVISLLEEIKKKEFKHLNSKEYKLFDLAVRELFNSIVKITRLLSSFFLYGGYGFEGMRHLDQAWSFLKYSDEPILNLEKYKTDE
jgi:hypothetical protein